MEVAVQLKILDEDRGLVYLERMADLPGVPRKGDAFEAHRVVGVVWFADAPARIVLERPLHARSIAPYLDAGWTIDKPMTEAL